MADPDSPTPDDSAATQPVAPMPVDADATAPAPAKPSPALSSKPSESSYTSELPLPEDLQTWMPQGEYIIESFLGQGGMGAVYKGLQMPLRRPVAIKILTKRQAGEEDDFAFEERFKREAYAMASLTHPNIVRVYDCGDAGEQYLFISMELLEGGDLSDAIKAGKCTPEVALKLIPQICDALQVAHEQGIVHRDIKPANIFLTADGRAKVADFGLAKKFDAQSTFATKTGVSMGTPDYAAPEQYDGAKDLDHRADIYSLGVMMYQMFTGALPRGSFRPASKRVPIDPRIDDILVKAMENDRADRHQSVAEIKAALLAVTTPAGKTQLPQTTAKRPAAVPITAPLVPAASRHASQPVASSVARPAVATPAAAAAATPSQKKGMGIGAIGAILCVLAALTAGAWVMMKPKPQANGIGVSAVTSGPPSSSPATATKDAPFINSLGMKFVPVPGTKVLMCIHETRRKDYAAYATEVAGVDATWKSPVVGKKPLIQADDHPVVQANWNDAVAFCTWLGKKEGRTYRLPSEREWNLAIVIRVDDPASINDTDLAAKLGSQYQWGTPKQEDAVNFGNYEGGGDGFEGTAPVMSFKPNHLGIYDLGGNAWEWTEDLFIQGDTERTLRGCGYRNHGPYRKSSVREATAPEMRAAPDGDYARRVPGFRVVLTPAAERR